MTLSLKVLILAVVLIVELAAGTFLAQRFFARERPELAIIMAAQAAFGVAVVAVVLFVVLE